MLRQQFGERWDAWYQGWYSGRDFDEQVAPASGQLRVPNTNAFFVAPAALGAPSFVNVEYRFLNEDADPRLTGYEDAQQHAVGVGFDAGGDWRIDGYVNFSKNEGFQRRGAITNGAALTNALASNNPATAFNPYGDGTFNVSNNPALVDLIVANRDTYGTSKERDFAVKADGPLFELPGGDMRLAIGVERHDNEFEQTLNATNVLATGEVSTKNVLNRRHNTSAFAELYVPIVRGVPGVQELNLSIAARYEDYSDFGETTDPKFGLTWQPIETLTARATYGTSFRAPSLVDTSEQIHNIFIQNLTDPASVTGGHARHLPQRRTLYAAARGSHHVVRGTRLAPARGARGSQRIGDLLRCGLHRSHRRRSEHGAHESGRVRPLHRPPSAAERRRRQRAVQCDGAGISREPGSAKPGGARRNINAIVDGRRANLAETQQTGVDVNLMYAFNTSIGDWRVGLDAAKILEVTRSTAPGITPVDVVDTFGNPVDLRARASVNWRLGGLSANLYFNYVDGYLNTAVTPNVEVDDYQTVDAALIYEFENTGGFLNGLSLSLAGQDIFDEEPPVVLNGVASWDSQNVSPLGRLVSFVVTKRW